MNKNSRLRQDYAELYQTAMFDHMLGLSQKVGQLERDLATLRAGSGKSGLQASLSNAYQDFLPQDRLERVENSTRAMAREIQSVHERISGMRLDRQLRAAPSYILEKFKKSDPPLVEMAPPGAEKEVGGKQKAMPAPSGYDIAVLCPVYPGGARPYGGEFIHKRARAYVRAGFKVCVLEVNPKRSDEQDHTVANIRVLRCGLKRAEQFLKETPPEQIAVHQLEQPLWDVLKPLRTKIPVTVWIHGFEARHWRELEGNFTDKDLKTMRKTLDEVTETRKKTMTEVLSDRQVKKIFVSGFMQSVTEKFTGEKAVNVEVIHNPVLESDFPYRPKKAADRFSILWVRSFGAHNYSNDLSRDAILELSKREYFSDLKISVYGDGKLFNESTDPLQEFPNISINRQFVPTEKLRELHSEHGIMLVPSRWDSQGLTCGEAMSSGLVPVTNNVAALPEFVNDSCGFLCKPNDPVSLADAIDTCIQNPKLFLKKSRAATKRAQAQCGETSTIGREVKLLKTRVRA